MRPLRSALAAAALLASCGQLALAQPAPPPRTWPDSLRAALATLIPPVHDTVTQTITQTVHDTAVVHDTLVVRDTLVLHDTVVVASTPTPPVPPVIPPIAPPPAASTDTLLARYLQNFATYADVNWNRDGAGYLNSDYYDGAYSYDQAAQRPEYTDAQRAEFRRRADTIVVDYRVNYLERNAYGASPHWSLLRGLAAHYRATGDTMSRHAVTATADRLWLATLGYYPHSWGPAGSAESRIAARVLQAQVLGAQLALDPAKQRTYRARIDTVLTQLVAWQQPDGSYPAPIVCGGQLNYMVGLLNTALIDTYAVVPDPRIPPLVQRAGDYLLTQWRSDGSFDYASVDCSTGRVGAASVGKQDPAPDLNLQIAPALWWLTAHGYGAPYGAVAERAFAVGVAQAYLTGSKQFVENYVDGWQGLGWR